MLYLIPTFLSENTNILSEEVLEITRNLDEFIVENEKSARQFLKSINSKFKQSDFKFHLLNEHSTAGEIAELLVTIKKSKNIGLISEAGCPGVADPGAAVVLMAHENNIKVVPLTGPSSILLSLMASGLNGQSFIFHGYLPRDPAQLKNKLGQLEKDALKKKQTQIFIETPYRNRQLLNEIIQTCGDEINLCIACDLTSKNEFVKTKPISWWKKNVPDINKRPAIFLIGV